MKNTTALYTDFYQLTTMAAHFNNGTHNNEVVFDYYFRKSPFNANSFAFSAGLDHLIDFVQNMQFTYDQIMYLKNLNRFSDEFLDYLHDFKFTGTIKALEEGTLTGAEVRGVTVKCTVNEAHLLESGLLNVKNSETLWTTLAVKMKHAAGENRIWEGGLRRAQGLDAAVWSARCAYLGGMTGTSNVEAGFRFGIPVVGTHPHAWIQFFDSEFDAFLAYYRAHPKNTSLLVDTFNVLKSGVPNAIKVAKIAESEGNRIQGIRIDSGDLAYLSREARIMLDAAGLDYVGITASDSLTTKLINSIQQQGSAMSDWLVGTNYVTSQEQPALGGVFKLVSVKTDGGWEPKIKISDNPEKVLLPGRKKVLRIIDNDTNKHVADYICLEEETIDTTQPFNLFDPIHKFRKKTITNYRIEELLKPIFVDGKLVYKQKTLEETREYIKEQKNLLWDEQLREDNPAQFYVNISQNLLDLRNELIEREYEKIQNQ